MTDWRPTSDELAARLHLRLLALKPTWRVWHEVQMPVAHESNGRCDVWAMRVSWAQFCVRIYEIKASRSDFSRDVADGKYRKYLEHCNELWFATAPGLLKPEEVPEGCGLVEIRPPKDADADNRLRTVKRAPSREVVLGWKLLCGILMSHETAVDRRSGFPMPLRHEDRRFNRDDRREQLDQWRMEREHRDRSAGHDAASAVSAARAIEERCKTDNAAAEFGRNVARDLRVYANSETFVEKATEAWNEARKQLMTPTARRALADLVAACGGLEALK